MNVKDVSFKSLWRDLKQQGWVARRPSGLETQWKYLPPGGDPKGTRGSDYFVGEDEVIAHYLASLDTVASPHDPTDEAMALSTAADGQPPSDATPAAPPAHASPSAIRAQESTGEDDALVPDAASVESDSQRDPDFEYGDDDDYQEDATEAQGGESGGLQPGIPLPEMLPPSEGSDEDSDPVDAMLNRNGSADDQEDFEALDSGDEPEVDDIEKNDPVRIWPMLYAAVCCMLYDYVV